MSELFRQWLNQEPNIEDKESDFKKKAIRMSNSDFEKLGKALAGGLPDREDYESYFKKCFKVRFKIIGDMKNEY